MKYFIFRNHTVEMFFPGADYIFSGYDDISYIPEEAGGYIWFYQVPIKYNRENLAAEIATYKEKLQLVKERIPDEKPLLVFTLKDFYPLQYAEEKWDVKNEIESFNQYAKDLSEEQGNVKVIALDDFTANYTQQELIDWRFYFNSQTLLNPRLESTFRKWWSGKLGSIQFVRKKCLVLDLDNTLWGGVLGEDGIDGIKIGGDYPGKAFLYFQEALLELSRNGVILTICSKNNEADVLEAWEKNPFVVLKKEHFATWRINWNNKADNIREIAKELNIGIDSMVFVDDNPTERELVRQELPEVETPEFPKQPYELPVFFKNLSDLYFRVYSITEEDKEKTAQYKANAQRLQAQSSFTDMTSYLKSLNIKMVIESANEHNIPRIAQMTQKTNQFNLTTHRYTEADIHQSLKDGWRVWCLSVADKFGDSGITGCLMVKGNEIDTLLLSCRILGKGIEVAFVKTIMREVKERWGGYLNATYIPTKKNGQVADFYDKLGYFVLAEDEDGTKHYAISLEDADLEIENYYNIEIKK